MVTNVRGNLAVNKQVGKPFDMERFNLRRLNQLHNRKQHQFKNSNSFAALENLSDREDINRAREIIKENIKNPANHSLRLHELSNINHGLMKNVYIFTSKETDQNAVGTGSKPKNV